MARSTTDNGESIGELYARIGLNFDDMENAFVDVERSLAANIGRLNRANNIVRLQMQADLTGLDEATDAERIFEIRQRALNRQLDNQRTRLNLLQSALEDTRRRTGENSDATQRATIAFEQARLSVARLEQQLEDLNAGDQTSILDRFREFAERWNPAVTMATRLVGAFKIVTDATDDLLEKFRELQKSAYDFNILDLDKFDDFARKVRLAGGELDDIQGFIAGIISALVKGETDDPEWQALQKYGETIFDNTGKLKSYLEIWESIHRAYKKAKLENQEIPLLEMLGGESGIKDAMAALDKWERATENANKIVKAQVDYQQLEKADVASKNLSEQMDELGKALSAAFSPATTALAESLFNAIKSATEWLVKYKAELNSIPDTSILLSPIEHYKQMTAEEKQESQKLTAAMKYRDQNLKELFKSSEGLDKAHNDLKAKLKEREKSKGVDPFQQYAIQRTRDLKDAIDDLRVELDFDSEYMQAVKTAEIERQRALRQIVVGDEEREAIQAKYNADIEKAEKDHDDKIAEMTKETAALQYETTHSAFEKEIYDIEQWKQKSLEDLGDFKDAIGDKNRYLQESAAIVANAAAKETAALEKEIDRIKGKTLSLEEKIFKLDNDDKAAQVYDIQKDVTEMLESGDYNISRIADYYKKALEKIGIDPFKQEDLFYNVRLRADQFTPDIKLPEIDAPKLPELPNPKLTVDTDSAVTDFKTALQASIDPIKISTENIEDSFTTSAKALTDFKTALETATDQLKNLKLPTYQDSLQPADQSKKFSVPFSSQTQAPKKYDFYPPKDLKVDLPKLKDVPDISKLMQGIESKIADLIRTTATIANDVNKKLSQPVVNVNLSVNPNINLGGAYVFDNAMKLELTDDITTDVANAVTDAVTRGIQAIRL